jgi:hypothetical protein
MHAAQDFYASFCARLFDPVRNPFKIECVIDCKLTVLMIGCAKGQLAHLLQYLFVRPANAPGPKQGVQHASRYQACAPKG